MAGSVVADTLQDGAGNSTTMDNAIFGSAKAWANYNGSAATLNGNFNISSVTKSGTGQYVFNFTTAMPNANYSVTASSGADYTPNPAALFSGSAATRVLYVDAAQTTSSFTVRTGYSYAGGGSAYADFYSVGVAVFR